MSFEGVTEVVGDVSVRGGLVLVTAPRTLFLNAIDGDLDDFFHVRLLIHRCFTILQFEPKLGYGSFAADIRGRINKKLWANGRLVLEARIGHFEIDLQLWLLDSAVCEGDAFLGFNIR